MQAEATGIHRDGPAAKPKYFLFNIGRGLVGGCSVNCSSQRICDLAPAAAVLAELVLGIPKDAFPVAVMVIVVLLVRKTVLQNCLSSMVCE